MMLPPSHDTTSDGEALMSELNITPFVDVMLVLLIVFMVTLPMINHAVSMDLPQVSSTPMNTPEKKASLQVLSVDQLQWNDTPLQSLEALRQHLSSSLGPEQDKLQVYLSMDQKLPYGLAAEILALLQHAGIQKIGFVSEASSSKP